MINVHSYSSSLEPKHEIEANIGIALASSHNDQIDNFKKGSGDRLATCRL